MAKPKIYGPAARRRIDRAIQRDEARTDGSEPAGLPIGGSMLPRTYRRFTLAEQLDAGSSAAVDFQVGALPRVAAFVLDDAHETRANHRVKAVQPRALPSVQDCLRTIHS